MPITLPEPKGILFDFGNTLLREGDIAPQLVITKRLDLTELSSQHDAETVHQAAAELYSEVREQRKSALIEFPFQSLLRILCDQFGIAGNRSLADLELEVWQAISSMMPEDGIGRLLDYLQGRGIALGVVSNAMFGVEALRWELARHGLADAFRFVMSSADYGLRKPHSAIFRTAVARLGLRPQEVWFVGDNFENDVVGSSRAGLAAVWYNRHNAPGPGDVQVAQVCNWSEFPALVESTERRD